MNKSFFARLGLFALIAATATSSAFAGRIKTKGTTPPPPPAPTLISHVSGNTITIGDDKTTKTFTITQFTEIYVNSQKGTVADLKPGMVVSVAIGTDPTRASRINASGAPAADHSKKKK
jgi:hypothetical protein